MQERTCGGELSNLAVDELEPVFDDTPPPATVAKFIPFCVSMSLAPHTDCCVTLVKLSLNKEYSRGVLFGCCCDCCCCCCCCCGCCWWSWITIGVALRTACWDCCCCTDCCCCCWDGGGCNNACWVATTGGEGVTRIEFTDVETAELSGQLVTATVLVAEDDEITLVPSG